MTGSGHGRADRPIGRDAAGPAATAGGDARNDAKADADAHADAHAIAAALVEAEPAAPRPLGELIARLEASGRLRGVAPAGSRVGTSAGPRVGGTVGAMVRGLAFDSRLVGPGFVFVAVAGLHSDGHDFVAAAASQGAVAAIVERLAAGAGLPQIVVDDSRLALAAAAAWWYGDPSRELGVVGVTGTDGKTTTTFLAASVLEAAGISTGFVTTAVLKVGRLESANPEHVTTPEAPLLQRMLRAMARSGNAAAVVETTSHGLALNRVAEIAYDVAVFTNLTHEHLELHGTFEAYRAAKLGLFERLGALGGPKPLPRAWPPTAIVNADDAAAPHFIAAAERAGARLLTYGEAPAAAIRALAIDEARGSLRFEVATPRWRGPVEVRLFGRFNVHNALAAVALGEALELDPDRIREGLRQVRGVPGRMERIDRGQPFTVVVDYAHSPASLRTVLEILARAAGPDGGLIAVFGSAGERDVQKRPMMGRVAGERCRLVVVTDEDPRGESSAAILDEIAAGAIAAGKLSGRDLLSIPDRRAAIEAAFERARPGDVVLLAGKGHEQTIIMADGPRPWDERSEAIGALDRMGYRGE